MIRFSSVSISHISVCALKYGLINDFFPLIGNTHGPSAEDPPSTIVHEPDVIAPCEYLACWRFPILNHSSFLYSAITDEVSGSPLFPPMMYTLSSVDVVAYKAILKTILIEFN